MKPIIYTDDKNSEYIRDSHIYEDLIKKIANMNSELKELDNTLISIKSIFMKNRQEMDEETFDKFSAQIKKYKNVAQDIISLNDAIRNDIRCTPDDAKREPIDLDMIRKILIKPKINIFDRIKLFRYTKAYSDRLSIYNKYLNEVSRFMGSYYRSYKYDYQRIIKIINNNFDVLVKDKNVDPEFVKSFDNLNNEMERLSSIMKIGW